MSVQMQGHTSPLWQENVQFLGAGVAKRICFGGHLWQAVQYPGDQKNMTILDGTDVDQDKIGAAAHHSTMLKAGCCGGLVQMEEDLLLGNLGEVESA